MPTFDYQAYDQRGKAVSGVASADSDRLLRRKLRDKGLFVTEIAAVRSQNSGSTEVSANNQSLTKLPLIPNLRRSGSWRRKLSGGELALILRQLGTLVASGLPLDESLALMSEQSDSPRQQRAVENWRSQIIEGMSFAQALNNSVYKVPDPVVAAVAISEETGHLAKVIERLADEQEISQENRQQLSKGLIYPAVMMLVALAVIGIMMTYVVPQVTQVFINTKTELPLLTQVVIVLSDFARRWGIFLLLTMAIAIFVALIALKKPENRLRWDRRVTRLPAIGNWIRMANFGDWCRSLGLLLSSGVPALSALRIASSSLSNSWYRNEMDEVIENVRRGSSLHSALRQQDFVPAFVLHMIGSGEASSELDSMLMRVADYYRTRLNNSVDTALKLMEPALIVGMGIFVVLIVGAVLVPIVQMNQLI